MIFVRTQTPDLGKAVCWGWVGALHRPFMFDYQENSNASSSEYRQKHHQR